MTVRLRLGALRGHRAHPSSDALTEIRCVAAMLWLPRTTCLLALTGTLFAAAGCGGSDGSSQEMRTKLEGIIRGQLPGKVKRQGGGPVVVNTVQCTNAGGNKYDCIATVRGTDGQSGSVTEDVSIDGTCDADSCIWKTADAGNPVPAPGAEEPPADSADTGDGIATVGARLEGADYNISREGPGSERGSVGGFVTMVGEANFTVYFFDSETAAARQEGAFEQVAQEAPDQVAVKRMGLMIFVGTIEEPALLPREKFAEFIAVATGG